MQTIQEFKTAVRQQFEASDTLPDGRINIITDAWSHVYSGLSVSDIVAIERDAVRTEPRVAYYKSQGAHDPVLTYLLTEGMPDLVIEQKRRLDAVIASRKASWLNSGLGHTRQYQR